MRILKNIIGLLDLSSLFWLLWDDDNDDEFDDNVCAVDS